MNPTIDCCIYSTRSLSHVVRFRRFVRHCLRRFFHFNLNPPIDCYVPSPRPSSSIDTLHTNPPPIDCCVFTSVRSCFRNSRRCFFRHNRHINHLHSIQRQSFDRLTRRHPKHSVFRHIYRPTSIESTPAVPRRKLTARTLLSKRIVFCDDGTVFEGNSTAKGFDRYLSG